MNARDLLGFDTTCALDPSVVAGDPVAFYNGTGYPVKKLGDVTTFTGTYNGQGSALARLTSGKIVELYYNASGYPCFRIFSAAMVQLVGETVVTAATCAGTSLQVIPLANGNFCTFWTNGGAYPYFAIFDPTGATVKAATAIDGTMAWNVNPAIGLRNAIQLSGGNIVFAGQQNASTYPRYAIYDTAGTSVKAVADVVAIAANASSVTLTRADTGCFAVCWMNSANSYAAFRTFTAAGVANSAATDLNTTAQTVGANGTFKAVESYGYFAVMYKNASNAPEISYRNSAGAVVSTFTLSALGGTPTAYSCATYPSSGEGVFAAMTNTTVALKRSGAIDANATVELPVMPDRLGLSLYPTLDDRLIMVVHYRFSTSSAGKMIVYEFGTSLQLIGMLDFEGVPANYPVSSLGIHGAVCTETQILISMQYPIHKILALNHRPIVGGAASSTTIKTSGLFTITDGGLTEGAALSRFTIPSGAPVGVALSPTKFLM